MITNRSQDTNLSHDGRSLLSRRQLLFGGLVATVTVSFVPGVLKKASAALVTDTEPVNFDEVSRMLVGKHDLNRGVVSQAWIALTTKMADFEDRYWALNVALQKTAERSIETLKKSEIFADAGHRRTIIDIISAFYLGRVGDINSSSELNKAIPITYSQALMWSPTIDVTVLPTYARGGPGYWRATPSTLSND